MVWYDQSLILMCESFNMSTKIQFIFSNPKKGGKEKRFDNYHNLSKLKDLLKLFQADSVTEQRATVNLHRWEKQTRQKILSVCVWKS